MLEWKIYAQIHAVQSYQQEVNDKYLESSDIQHTGAGRVTSIFELSTLCFQSNNLKWQFWSRSGVFISDQSDGSNPVFDQSNLRHKCGF